jgi:hypothetical protein
LIYTSTSTTTIGCITKYRGASTCGSLIAGAFARTTSTSSYSNSICSIWSYTETQQFYYAASTSTTPASLIVTTTATGSTTTTAAYDQDIDLSN